MDLQSLVKYMCLSSIDCQKSSGFPFSEKKVCEFYRSNLTIEDRVEGYVKRVEMNDLLIYFCIHLEGMGRTVDILYNLKRINYRTDQNTLEPCRHDEDDTRERTGGVKGRRSGGQNAAV